MIKTLRLRNFKAFQDTGEIEIKPITVLAGPNSGGKSSILQSLLLLKQTLETEAPDIDLDLDGKFLKFSKFNELVFGKPSLQNCDISYKIGFEVNIDTENFRERSFQNDIEFSFRHRELEGGKDRVILDRFSLLSQIQGRTSEQIPQLTITFRNKQYYLKLCDGSDVIHESYKRLRISDITSGYFPRDHILWKVGRRGDLEKSEGYLLGPIFFKPLTGLGEELKNHLKYLGPLRGKPQRVYVPSASPSFEIDQSGENAAQILWLERDDTIQYLPNLYQEVEELSLLDAVSHVFKSLGVIEQIGVKSEKSIIYQILFDLTGSKSRKQVTIADVGFGISQLLPVVLMGVRSEKSSLLLFEQPEIHLHPKLQANLADFFLRMALLGKRIIVETHSDHFINRLRRRIAEDPTDELKDKISILFVHPPHDGQGATIEPLKIDRYGIIENWPPDFLPESADEAEAILTAGLEKRKG